MNEHLGIAIFAAWILVLITSVAALLWWKLRCAHWWDLVDKTEFPSPIEELQKHGNVDANFMFSSDLRRMATRTVALVLRCNRCGKSRIEKISSEPN